MRAWTRLEVDDVLAIRLRLAVTQVGQRDHFGGAEPLRRDLLESAVARQWAGYGDVVKYGTVHERAATLFYGIAMAHAFENGNKRTALVTLLVFLDRSQCILVDASQDDLYELVTKTVQHLMADGERDVDREVAAIASWVRARTRPIGAGDHKLDFRELKALLEAQGCTFDDPDRNYIKIRRGAHSVQIGFPKHNFDIAVQTVKHIRKKLDLDDLTATEFYDVDARVDDFVRKYQDLMSRLADL